MKAKRSDRGIFASESMISNADSSLISSLLGSLRSLIEDIRNPLKIQTTATPVAVRNIWTKHSARFPNFISGVVHLVVLILALLPWATTLELPEPTVRSVQIFTPNTPLILNLPLSDTVIGGGGGGGMRTTVAPSLGNLPRLSDEQILPPSPEVKNVDPIMIVEPTIIAPQMTDLPKIALLQLGDPNGMPGSPSAGPGFGGGIGVGSGRGVGLGDGPGFDEGIGGGFGGQIFAVGGGVTTPMLLKRVNPEYSDAARKAKYEGTLLLETVVRRDGTVAVRRVLRSLGYGLDETAIAAVQQWLFRPATTNGQAVDVWLQIEVTFTLL